MNSIARLCDHCKLYGEVVIADSQVIYCPQCKAKWGDIKEVPALLDSCPVCQCRQFYTAKDFNQFIGCLIMLIGIILVPFTYGISLPLFALMDWLLHRKVPTLINCYRCGSEFRGFENTKNFKPFMHHIGLKYDKYR